MDYLTATEFSKKWGITSRMVARYCETGRIVGAHKKGKTWLIPASAEKPLDQRCKKQTVKTIVPAGQGGSLESIGEAETYHTTDVYQTLGLTRETLRYYEDVGLIQPKRSSQSQYREFDLYDMSRLMSIDFFRKRGFSPVEIRELLTAAAPEDYAALMHSQLDRLDRKIAQLQQMRHRLVEAQSFCESVPDIAGSFSIRELPLYCVWETLPSVSSFGEYRNRVLKFLDLEQEDILSNLVRAISFDETGYKGSEMYVVKPTVRMSRAETFLEHGKCLYTTLIADNNDPSVPEKMFDLCHNWATEHKASFRGVVYIFIRFVMLKKNTDQHFYEVWVPLK